MAQRRGWSAQGWLCLALLLAHSESSADAADGNRAVALRTAAPLQIDGVLNEPVWGDAIALTSFYEVYPGDRTPPPVRTEVKYAYDDRYLYIAARLLDPDPTQLRAPFVRRDRVGAGQDYVQFFIDPFGTRRSAQVFRINVRGNQTDGTVNEATGTEDDAPDFPYDVATQRTEDGWQAELRIPWSSLRYPPGSHEPWAIMAYRGWPRGQNLQIASGPVARAATCFLCFATTVEGFETPPRSATAMFRPAVVATSSDASNAVEPGLDVQWKPTGRMVVDATLNPDFSELEADAPQITGNARYALSVTEKRPFFLESVDLLETPLQFIYTRSIADPGFGLRATQRGERMDATAWAARDEGGGDLIIPGPFGSQSRTLEQTDVMLGRARWTQGRFAVAIEGSGRDGDDYHNAVTGADLAWQPGDSDRIATQWLASDTRDPASTMTTDDEHGTAWQVQWDHAANRFTWSLRDDEIAPKFRADTGFMPVADLREHYADFGVRFFDLGILNEIKPYVGWLSQETQTEGLLISRGLYPGVYLQGARNLYGYAELHYDDETRAFASAPVQPSRFLRFDFAASPQARWPKMRIYGDVGRLLDVETGDLRDGHVLTAETLLRPRDRIELAASVSGLRLSALDTGASVATENDESLTAIYHFTAALDLRIQGVYSDSERNAPEHTTGKQATTTLVLGYRPSWRTTAYLGASHVDDDDSTTQEWTVFAKWTGAMGN